jgi:hypothetical protein
MSAQSAVLAFFVVCQPGAMKDITLSDVLLIAGFVLLLSGVAAYDWRLALIVCGVLLLAGGVAGMVRGK